MKKTLLLVYIHGFQGGDGTFGNFPERLRGLVSRALPSVKVVSEVYPKYETRGDLRECVSRFREWLQNKVIDLEVENQTPSPTVDPAVHVFLVGHSMGGIVGAETLLLLSDEQPITSSSSNISPGQKHSGLTDSQRLVEPGSFMFPHIQGLLAFDTPFLGIAPGAVSCGAEGQYKTITNTLSDVASAFGFGRGNNNSNSANAGRDTRKQEDMSASNGDVASSTDVAAIPSWQRWGRYAMFAGAVGAAAAGGAAAIYQQRQNVSGEWDWVSSHLEFLGCLARPGEQLQRLERLTKVRRERGIRGTNFYTCLGAGAQSLLEKANSTGKAGFIQSVIRSKSRTFCFLPQDVDNSSDDRVRLLSEQSGLRWIRAVNDTATDEIKAHITMFHPRENPGFYVLAHEACDVIAKSVDQHWYLTSAGPAEESQNEIRQNESENVRSHLDTDSGFMDDAVVID